MKNRIKEIKILYKKIKNRIKEIENRIKKMKILYKKTKDRYQPILKAIAFVLR